MSTSRRSQCRRQGHRQMGRVRPATLRARQRPEHSRTAQQHARSGDRVIVSSKSMETPRERRARRSRPSPRLSEGGRQPTTSLQTNTPSPRHQAGIRGVSSYEKRYVAGIAARCETEVNPLAEWQRPLNSSTFRSTHPCCARGDANFQARASTFCRSHWLNEGGHANFGITETKNFEGGSQVAI